MIALIGTSIFAVMSVKQIGKEVETVKIQDLPIAQLLTTIQQYQLEQLYKFQLILRHGEYIGSSQESLIEFEAALKEFDAFEILLTNRLQEVDDNLDVIINAQSDGAVRKLFQDIKKQLKEIDQRHRRYIVSAREIIRFFNNHDIESAFSASKVLEKEEEDLSDEISSFVIELEGKIYKELSNVSKQAKSISVIMGSVALVVILITLSMAIFSVITLKTLRSSLSNVGNSIQQVASAASQSSNAIGMVADGAKQQSEAISQAVTAVNQSMTVLSDVSKSADEATILSKGAASTVNGGKEQMSKMVSVVNRIAENSGKINKITDVINNIASQTNMLSLNAAIEAARAGEHGKGFAVVAEQVRKLAENSRSSVQDIIELIDQAVADANEAVQVAEQVSGEMSKIEQASENTEKMMRNIATSMEEQVATTSEMQHNMDTLKSIGNNNANAAEEITQTIMELSRIADETKTEINRFNI
ncbi:MAG TPA: methyl-accepting chemotaxis protein [Pseudomonadales bacterium]